MASTASNSVPDPGYFERSFGNGDYKMSIMKGVIAILVCCALVTLQHVVTSLDNGVALTPPMGFNNFMAGNKTIGAKGLTYIADFIERSGLRDLGYIYINTDEGWELPDRHVSTGELQENPSQFPDGIANFIKGLHNRGFKFGIYGAASAVTCGILPGQLYHEIQDGQTYAKWGVDYVKSDNCANFALDPSVRFRAMRDALNATGRAIVYSIEPFSITPEPALSSQVANLWRTGNDIHPIFQSILNRADMADKWAPLAGPSLGWNDPDMIHLQNSPPLSKTSTTIQIQAGLTLGQNRVHFGLWSIMKAPLLLSADLPELHSSVFNLMANPEVIAVNQDPLGIQARKIQVDGRPLPWLVGSADCSLPEGSLGYARSVTRNASSKPTAGEGVVDIRLWSLIAINDNGIQKRLSSMVDSCSASSKLLIQHDATKRCLAVYNKSRVVLLPFCPSNDDRFLWRFDKGFGTVTAITNVDTQKALAIADSFLYARQHGKDAQNVTDLAYGANRLTLVDPKDQESCTSRYCQNYDPVQMWYYSFFEKTLQHSLYASSMNHIENYQDKKRENGFVLTPKVPTFRRNCLAHILSEDNTGTDPGNTEVWGGPLAGGDIVVGLVNRGSTSTNFTARLDLLIETSGLELTDGIMRVDNIRDLWGRRDVSVKDSLDDDGNIILEVPSRDMVLLRVHLASILHQDVSR